MTSAAPRNVSGNFLTRPIAGIPVWGWGGILIAGGLLAWFFLRQHNQSQQQQAVLGQLATSGSQSSDGNIDPGTGVPYSVEEAIDPNTGLPVYLTLMGYGAQGQQGQQGQRIQPGPPAPQVIQPPTSIHGGAPGQTPSSINPIIPGRTAPTPPPIVPTKPLVPAQPPSRPISIVHATSWPSPGSSLYTIWQQHGAGLPFATWEQQVLQLNSQIRDPNLIYPNEEIRIPA